MNAYMVVKRVSVCVLLGSMGLMMGQQKSSSSSHEDKSMVPAHELIDYHELLVKDPTHAFLRATAVFARFCNEIGDKAKYTVDEECALVRQYEQECPIFAVPDTRMSFACYHKNNAEEIKHFIDSVVGMIENASYRNPKRVLEVVSLAEGDEWFMDLAILAGALNRNSQMQLILRYNRSDRYRSMGRSFLASRTKDLLGSQLKNWVEEHYPRNQVIFDNAYNGGNGVFNDMAADVIYARTTKGIRGEKGSAEVPYDAFLDRYRDNQHYFEGAILYQINTVGSLFSAMKTSLLPLTMRRVGRENCPPAYQAVHGESSVSTAKEELPDVQKQEASVVHNASQLQSENQEKDPRVVKQEQSPIASVGADNVDVLDKSKKMLTPFFRTMFHMDPKKK